MVENRELELRKFGARIREERENAGLGTRRLASDAGIRRKTLQGLEGGAYWVNRQVAVAVITALLKTEEERKAHLTIVNELWEPRKDRRKQFSGTLRRDMRKQSVRR